MELFFLLGSLIILIVTIFSSPPSPSSSPSSSPSPSPSPSDRSKGGGEGEGEHDLCIFMSQDDSDWQNSSGERCCSYRSGWSNHGKCLSHGVCDICKGTCKSECPTPTPSPNPNTPLPDPPPEAGISPPPDNEQICNSMIKSGVTEICGKALTNATQTFKLCVETGQWIGEDCSPSPCAGQIIQCEVNSPSPSPTPGPAPSDPTPDPTPGPAPPGPTPPSPTESCDVSCVGLVFTGGDHRGEDVCKTPSCGNSAPYVGLSTFGCSADVNAWGGECCDIRTCSGLLRLEGTLKENVEDVKENLEEVGETIEEVLINSIPKYRNII